jgi:pimeloyl-ACP methyl ester carboxylesterase
MLYRIPLITIFLALSALLGSCATTSAPDLKRLYTIGKDSQHTMTIEKQPPVILVHGILGARLRIKNTAKEVWPGGTGSILFDNYKDIALTIDPEKLRPAPSQLKAYDITSSAAGRDYYGAIIRTLANAGGYIPGASGEKILDRQPRYYVYYYDWRQDNVQSARGLGDLIKQIRSDYGKPDLKVDIVAHSMGGLITRYFMRYGYVDVLDDNEFPVNNYGSSRVRKVVLLGTPNLGSASAIRGFLQGYRIGMRSIPTEVLMTMPSAYQLFPHPINDSLIMADGKALDRDLFDIEIWRAFEWSIFDPKVRQRILGQFDDEDAGKKHLALLERYFEKYIERARRFVWSLTVPGADSSLRYIVFGGDCELTPTRMLVEEVNGKSILRLHPERIKNRIPGIDYEKLMLEPGDGRVTRASLLARTSLDPSKLRHKYSSFTMDQSILLCESHDSLTGNISFQNNLLNILLTRD